MARCGLWYATTPDGRDEKKLVSFGGTTGITYGRVKRSNVMKKQLGDMMCARVDGYVPHRRQ